MPVVSRTTSQGVRVVGIPELTRALKAVGDGADKEFKAELRAISKSVIRRAQYLMGGYSSGTMALLRPSVTMKGAGILMPAGGPASRTESGGYYPWLDFGGGKPGVRGVTSSTGPSHSRSTSQKFKRPAYRSGRYLYPAIAASTDEIGDAAYSAVSRLAHRNNLRTT